MNDVNDDPIANNNIVSPKLSQNAQKLKELEDKMSTIEVKFNNQGCFE